MDATRRRRTRDRARRAWYACWRQRRFARFMGLAVGAVEARETLLRNVSFSSRRFDRQIEYRRSRVRQIAALCPLKGAATGG